MVHIKKRKKKKKKERQRNRDIRSQGTRKILIGKFSDWQTFWLANFQTFSNRIRCIIQSVQKLGGEREQTEYHQGSHAGERGAYRKVVEAVTEDSSKTQIQWILWFAEFMLQTGNLFLVWNNCFLLFFSCFFSSFFLSLIWLKFFLCLRASPGTPP